MKNNITLSIIISTWKRSNILKKILYSFSRQLILPPHFFFEIIISDSFSNDGTRGVINLFKSNKNFKLKYINCRINNLSAKRNAGIKVANSNNFIFLDDDCIPERYFIKKYLNIFRSRNTLYSGIVEYPKKWLIKSNYLEYRQSRHFISQKENLLPNKFVAMNFGIRVTNNLKKNFYFDERFTGYGFEDFEFAKRMTQHQVKLKTIDAKIVHYEYGKNFELYLNKMYALSKYGVTNLKKVNNSYFEDTIYHRIDNNFIVKFIVFFRFKRTILFIIEAVKYLEKSKLIKSFFIFRIGILLSYINGNIDREYSKLINKKKWYE